MTPAAPPRRRPRDRRVAVGAGVLVVSLVLLHWAFLHHLPFAGGPHGAVVRAEVRTAAGVNSRTPVRVGGTDVGSIERLEPGRSPRTTTIVMRVTEPRVRLHADARAHVRYRTLLGGSMYVDLDPGSASARPLGAGVIPLARTGAQVDWDEFNLLWAKPVPRAERRLITGLADALADPRAVRSLLRAGAPALATMGRAARAGRGRYDGDLARLVAGLSRTLHAVAGDGENLDALIRGAGRTVAASARARAGLGATLEAAPPALRSTRAGMARLDATLARLDPLATELSPGARAAAPAMRRLRPALASLDRLLTDSAPLLAIAPDSVAALGDAARAGVPFLRALRPLSNRVVADVVPWLNSVDPATGLKVYEAVGPWASGQNDSYANFDDNGHYLRAVLTPSTDGLLLPCDADEKACALVRRVLRAAAGGQVLGRRR